MKTKRLVLLVALVLPTAHAQISGTITGNAIYDQRAYLNGNLTINGRAWFENGVEMAAGSAPATLTVNGNTVIKAIAGLTSAPLRSVTVTGELDLNGPLVCADNLRVVGSLVARRGIGKISAGSITITGDLALADEGTLILETSGGDVTIGGNLLAPVNGVTRATVVISARSGGIFRFTGTRDARVTLSTSSGSSIGAPLNPINMSVRTTITSSPLIIGFVLSSPEGGAGSVTSRFLVRAIGPGLRRFGVSGEAEDPKITVNLGTGFTIDDWATDTANRVAVEAAIQKSGAFPIEVGSKDAAVVIDAPPGALTLFVTNASGRAGEALVEVYRVP